MIKICKLCEKEFNETFIDKLGKQKRIQHRDICVNCKPLKTPKIKEVIKCKICGKDFQARIKINGIRKDLSRRNFCINCIPLKTQRKSSIGKKEKECIDCKKIFPNNKNYFSTNGKRNFLSSNCISCRNKKEIQRRYIRKTNILKIYGANKCYLCGYSKNLSALVFHHKNPKEKDRNISKISCYKRKEEIKKCILVCFNCHMEIHAGLHPEILRVSLSSNESTKKSIQNGARIKREMVDYLGGKCSICGYKKCLRALNFHHKNKQEKKLTIGEKQGKPLRKIKDEIDKCELLCANCHQEKHYSITQPKVIHSPSTTSPISINLDDLAPLTSSINDKNSVLDISKT